MELLLKISTLIEELTKMEKDDMNTIQLDFCNSVKDNKVSLVELVGFVNDNSLFERTNVTTFNIKKNNLISEFMASNPDKFGKYSIDDIQQLAIIDLGDEWKDTGKTKLTIDLGEEWY